ncbi:hypothetical protein AYI68_g5687 [Smittium mucronatum]|uniref:Uncharacterized protein n=1 Tax=Smittium mucronatum TaxID=133383 RepID=A0A1R0GTL8_9FUNG|nr:hypothetical protein AYI68_g5687 [Smittium mucronatum]
MLFGLPLYLFYKGKLKKLSTPRCIPEMKGLSGWQPETEQAEPINDLSVLSFNHIEKILATAEVLTKGVISQRKKLAR